MVPRVRKWFELVKVKLPAKISMYMCANACTIIGDRTSEGGMHFSALGSWECTGIDESALASQECTEIMSALRSCWCTGMHESTWIMDRGALRYDCAASTL